MPGYLLEIGGYESPRILSIYLSGSGHTEQWYDSRKIRVSECVINHQSVLDIY